MVPWENNVPRAHFNHDNSIPIGRLPPDSIFPVSNEHGHHLLERYLPSGTAAHHAFAAQSAARAYDALRFPSPHTSRAAAMEAAALLADVAAVRSAHASQRYHGVPAGASARHGMYEASQRDPYGRVGMQERAAAEQASYRQMEASRRAEMDAKNATDALVGLRRSASGEPDDAPVVSSSPARNRTSSAGSGSKRER
jgi:hypothetical protein